MAKRVLSYVQLKYHLLLKDLKGYCLKENCFQDGTTKDVRKPLKEKKIKEKIGQIMI